MRYVWAFALLAACGMVPAVLAAQPVIIDTDAGPDDLMAVAYLLADTRVTIEAITIVNGLTHVETGGHHIQRLIELSGRRSIRVLTGAGEPLPGGSSFPEEWRQPADELRGVRLPRRSGMRPKAGAVEYLRSRLSESQPLRILALGPLTNLALAIRDSGEVRAGVQVTAMGGALEPNDPPEWNLRVDPAAARMVLERMNVRLITMDAARMTPITPDWVRRFRSMRLRPLGRVVSDLLRVPEAEIAAGHYHAWDPLAALALVSEGIVGTSRAAVTVDGQGRLIRAAGSREVEVATRADRTRFDREFMTAFRR